MRRVEALKDSEMKVKGDEQIYCCINDSSYKVINRKPIRASRI